jgi:glucokinase
VRTGKVFVDVEGTRDRLLEVNARDEVGAATMGGTLAGKEEATIVVHVRGAADAQAVLIADGAVLPVAQPIKGDDDQLTFRLPQHAFRRWFAVTVRRGERVLLIGNPIYRR